MNLAIRWSRVVMLGAFAFHLAGCLPCGCRVEKLAAAFLPALGTPAPSSFTLTFDSPLFGDDRFTATATFPGAPPKSAGGTFSKSGDTITFTFDPSVVALGIANGKYTITCDGKNMSLKGPAFATPIVFSCAD